MIGPRTLTDLHKGEKKLDIELNLLPTSSGGEPDKGEGSLTDSVEE